MNNQENLFNKIKSAAENSETKDFSSMEKVWSRIDAKLDSKVEKNNRNNWKRLIVAASIFIFVTIGFKFFIPNDEIVFPNTKIVNGVLKKEEIHDSIITKQVIVSSGTKNTNLKKNADEILKNQISKPAIVANAVVSDEISINSNQLKSYINNYNSNNDDKSWLVNRNFESYVVKYPDSTIDNGTDKNYQDKNQPNSDAIVIVNGKMSTLKKSELDADEHEIITELSNPIYYINGVLFTENELFGSNPTSPYAPLAKQKIESTIVLNPERAIKIYGDKGKNGVVIITTKDGKPVKKKE